MKTMRGCFLASSMIAMLSLLGGCASSSAPAPVSAEAKAPAADNAPAGAPEPAAAPASGAAPAEQSARPSSAPSQEAAPSRVLQEEDKRARDDGEVAAAEPADRPGLGTEWGETRASQIQTVPFVRADPQAPFAMASLFYNDEQGARAMSSMAGFRRTSAGTLPVAGGMISIGLRDETGNFLTGFVAGGRNYAIGEAGRRYSIVIRNQSPNRFECVVSVDGLDVVDGRAGSFSKRGYLLQPNGELEVDGFRQSMDTVAAFRFGSVRDSYANQKHGETRNVGVIGFAFFHERGTNPFPWTNEEIQRRHDANPFPGQFATPPGN